ncbi:MAG: helix-turn-helix transcriptional regulator [Sphingobium sp.]
MPAQISRFGVTEPPVGHLLRAVDPSTGDLSPRERECLLMTATGASDADVASRIAISESTVRFHLRNAARKLSVRSRREAIYLAAKLDLI